MRTLIPHGSLLPGLALLLGGLALCGGMAMASGDAAEGARKAMFCAYCHGADGNPLDARTPRLAGQSARTLIAKMKREPPYQNTEHPMMQAFVTGGCLNDRDIRNLAAFYAAQPVRQAGQPATGKPAGR